MHFESDTKFHSKRFPEIHLRNGYEAVEYKTLRRISRYIGQIRALPEKAIANWRESAQGRLMSEHVDVATRSGAGR
jgi:hypothetical protein